MTRNQVAELTLRVKAPLAFDLSSSFESTGRFVLVDEYDIAGGGIITELVHDEQEGLREEARQREYAWLTGDVRAEDRAIQYGHRAAIVLFTGSAQTGKTFLARRVESLLVADSRHAYLLEGENLLQGWMRIYQPPIRPSRLNGCDGMERLRETPDRHGANCRVDKQNLRHQLSAHGRHDSNIGPTGPCHRRAYEQGRRRGTAEY